MFHEQVIDSKDFSDVQDLTNLLSEWLSYGQHLTGFQRTCRVVGVDGTTLSRAVLVERQLSDMSFVYDVRLS